MEYARVPAEAIMDAKNELTTDTGAIKHAAIHLFNYYCLRRRRDTGLCFPSLKRTSEDTGIPKSNVSMLKTFLKNIAWIEIYDSGVIRPLKGFVPDEERLKIWLKHFLLERISVLIIRIIVLNNRTLVLIIRTLFKRNINQLIQPTYLTSERTDLRNAESATHAPDEKKVNVTPAGKPAPRLSAKLPTNAAPAGKPADNRSKHPAVQIVKIITGRYPPKTHWNAIIRACGEIPDRNFIQQCWEKWAIYGGNPQNFDQWLILPAETGKLPERFERNFEKKNGKKETDWQSVGKNSEVENESEIPKIPPLSATGRELALAVLRAKLQALGQKNPSLNTKSDLLIAELRIENNLDQKYSFDDWLWLVAALKK